MRHWLAMRFIKIGFAILEPGTRKMFRDILMYNVPGALTEAEKADVRVAKADWIKAGKLQR